jgi:hypothetical protein
MKVQNIKINIEADAKPALTVLDEIKAKFQEVASLFAPKTKNESGGYDKGYAEGDLPGLPGVKDAEESDPKDKAEPYANPEGSPTTPATPTNYTEEKKPEPEDHEEPDEDDMEECVHCKGKGKMKKAKNEEEEAEEEEEETIPPTKAESKEEEKSGNYDGGYAEKKAYTRDDLMNMCGIGLPSKKSQVTIDFEKACEIFTGNQFNVKE